MILCEAVPANEGAGEGMALMIAVILAFLTMTIMNSRGQKKEKEKHTKWVENLPKNAHVVTRSGIHGSVMSVKADTVVLKVDEEKGVKLTFSKDAISHQVDPTVGTGA